MTSELDSSSDMEIVSVSVPAVPIDKPNESSAASKVRSG